MSEPNQGVVHEPSKGIGPFGENRGCVGNYRIDSPKRVRVDRLGFCGSLRGRARDADAQGDKINHQCGSHMLTFHQTPPRCLNPSCDSSVERGEQEVHPTVRGAVPVPGRLPAKEGPLGGRLGGRMALMRARPA